MNVLIYHSDPQKLKILAFCVESDLGNCVTQAQSFENAMTSLFADSPVDLLVINYDQSALLFQYLASVGARMPVILLCPNEKVDIKAFSDIPIIAKINEANATTELAQLIKQNIPTSATLKYEDGNYCRIKIDLLLNVVPLQGDVYIRLSSIKFVKLFNAGVIFTQADLNKILGIKRIEHLYIEKSNIPDFVKKFKIELQRLNTVAEENDPDYFVKAGQVHEAIHQLANHIGFTPEVMDIAKSHVQFTLKLIGTSPKLSSLVYKKLLNTQSYIADHSIMISHIACCIARKMNWPSESTFHKLVLAGLLHDITILVPEYAKIQTKEDLTKFRELAKPEVFNAVKNHPFEAAQIVDKLTDVPSDVCVIVQQHHERPDGTGFPRGLHAPAIAPLASVFLVAHDMVDQFIEHGDALDMENYWLQRMELYSSGTFKKIVKALRETPEDPAA